MVEIPTRYQTPAQTAPVILLRLGLYRFLANVAAQARHLTQDGTSNFKLPGSPTSFSAWLWSPCCCFPVNAADRDGQITGNSYRHSSSRSRRAASLAGFFDWGHAFDGPLR